MKTVKLFHISLILFIVSMVAAFSWNLLGFKNEDVPIVAVLLIVCFALNVAGAFVGFTEERKSKGKFLYGLVGNFTFVVLYVSFFIYVLTTI
jgi:hypothetical protein